MSFVFGCSLYRIVSDGQTALLLWPAPRQDDPVRPSLMVAEYDVERRRMVESSTRQFTCLGRLSFVFLIQIRDFVGPALNQIRWECARPSRLLLTLAKQPDENDLLQSQR